ncbi:BlaI/MecI/CopY family transcriptional regulator [Mycobacterium sp. 050128]|uniref:BlaI/MecI/CopY family transcriptional regulator n=1 Tax=Mycobacterium sp. 050128 TaxID=3096112 RepID=UPI002ED9C234
MVVPNWMPRWKLLGQLERRVMEQLWSSSEPQTVRQVHAALSMSRDLAYTTAMTVLRRLADKGLVLQQRDDRAHRYVAVRSRDELVAELMLDVFDQLADSGDRRAVLVQFVESVRTEDAHALQSALDELEIRHASAGAGSPR